MVFFSIYGCESWTIKNADHWRTNTFELWCWKRLLRIPLTVRRSNQSILKEINLEYSLEGLLLKQAPIFGHLIQKADSLEKTLMLRKIESKRRRWQQMKRQLDSITNWMVMNLSSLAWEIPVTGQPDGLQSMGSQRVGHNWSDLAQHTLIDCILLKFADFLIF